MKNTTSTKKVIGIVDITTVGATLLQRQIANIAPYLEFCVHSFPVSDYLSLVKSSDWSAMANRINQSIKKLQAAGATVIAIPSNTPHYAYEQITAQSSLPVLNLIQITVDACVVRKYQRVAVLGTRQTMEGTLYQQPLTEKGITPVIPCPELITEIDNLILKIIRNVASEVEIESIGKKIAAMDCDAFILGCTELPDVYDGHTLNKPCLDTTSLLAIASLNFSSTQNQKPSHTAEYGRQLFSKGMSFS